MAGFLHSLGLALPIIQAPMAGGISTPELAAAVSNAEGLGSLGCGYLTPDQLLDEFRSTRRLTRRPLNINLFAGGYHERSDQDPQPMLQLLAEAHKKFALRAPILPSVPPNPFPAQLEAVLEAAPEVFSFTFGIPPAEALARLRNRGIRIVGTATTIEEARALESARVDAIVAQGSEAGAHRGTFLGSFESSMVPTLDLVRQICAAISIPVIASGGLMDGRDIARALKSGAEAVQLGTVFLTCPEAGTSAPYRRALLSAREDTTVITRAYSGRPARGLRNRFIQQLEGRERDILPYPLQNSMTRPMRTASAHAGDSGYLSLWAGQGVSRIRELPAAELIAQLVSEMNVAGARTARS